MFVLLFRREKSLHAQWSTLLNQAHTDVFVANWRTNPLADNSFIATCFHKPGVEAFGPAVRAVRGRARDSSRVETCKFDTRAAHTGIPTTVCRVVVRRAYRVFHT